MRIERIALQYEITPAQLIYKYTPAQMEISVTHGGLSIESDPIQMELDNRQFFDSIGIKGIQTQSMENAQKGRDSAQESAGRYTRQKNAMLGPDGATIAQISAQQKRAAVKTELSFIPTEAPKASWSGGDVNIQVIKDKVEISWKPYEMEFTYVPYSISFDTEEL